MTQANTLPLEETGSSLVAPPPRRLRALGARTVLAGAFIAVASVGAQRYLHWAGQYEKTDDAYIDGRVHPVSARVNGTVEAVLTDDNRVVKAGDPVVRLDDRDLQVRLDEAKSDLNGAIAAVAQAEAQLPTARAAIERADTVVAQTRAQADKADLDIRRASQLLQDRAVPRSEYDTADTNNTVALAGSANARSSRSVAVASLREAQANVSVALRKKERAEAAVRDAELQLSYITVVAPTDGRVGKRSVEVGQRVQPGQALLAVVENDVWVVANFKESQLAKMRVGESVEVAVDAIPDHVFTGTVDSFAPGTGAKFSLLPADNATGNFTKIVQRVPVKIRFDAASTKGYEDELLAGLSVVATVRVQP
jgi:membrane fusion protein (multidrug efflux system)